ncbi:PrpR N-terminal domain-containing protein [Lacrimispora sp.]|uniref:PrpR N-terminal domain-containing protein n=1 Tax=Lacrimispora sp. TaxID=2719234 RepID=UPI002FDA30E8
MGKIALLVSREEMLYQAHNILQEKKYELNEMKVIKTEDAVSEARRSIGAGASIIIARGLQASLIKQYTDIPVVEIVITAQEMALLVNKAKQILKKENPVIGVVGFKNMFCDMSYFDVIHEIEMRTYFADKSCSLEAMTKQAIMDGVDLIIGGDTAVEIAGEAGMPSLFLSNTEDSLRNALSMAESVDYAMGVEKRNAAQMETLLDHSFSGVVRLDASGIIMDLNPIMEDMLGTAKEKVLGKAAGEVFPDLGKNHGKESYSLFMEINRTSVFAVVAPVMIDQRMEGAILTCHRMKKRRAPEPDLKGKGHLKGFIALGEFDDILQESRAMKECIRLAKLYALSEKAVFIEGEAGTEKRLLAQSIHNAGLHKGGPFAVLSCEGIGNEGQLDMIFGDKGAAVQAGGGSLLLEEIHCLTKDNQYRLCQLIRYKTRLGKDGARYPGLDVRVMATSDLPLHELVRDGILREELYFLLSGLTVRIPPFRERKEDLEKKLTECFRDCCDHYSRFHVLTSGARKLLLDYPWEGNLFQIESFCERLILTANKRSIDEGFAEQVFMELYPLSFRNKEEEKRGEHGRDVIVSEEEERIAKALLRYGGNREETARALGISKATLWRKRKKYHLE